jgi:hypothetical protein
MQRFRGTSNSYGAMMMRDFERRAQRGENLWPSDYDAWLERIKDKSPEEAEALYGEMVRRGGEAEDEELPF